MNATQKKELRDLLRQYVAKNLQDALNPTPYSSGELEALPKVIVLLLDENLWATSESSGQCE